MHIEAPKYPPTMIMPDTEIELRSNVSKQIRDKLVGRIFQVKLKGESQQADGHKGFFKKVSHRVGIHRRTHSNPPKEEKEDAAVLLTVQTVEVYSASSVATSKEQPDRSEHSAHEGPQLHPPPSTLEGHVNSYSIGMSQVRFCTRCVSLEGCSSQIECQCSDADLQVLRVAQSDSDVTVFFHPNSADSEVSSDTASSFTCEFSEPQVLTMNLPIASKMIKHVGYGWQDWLP